MKGESTFDAHCSGSLARSFTKWKYHYYYIHIENVVTMTLHCPGIVFLDIQCVQNNIGSLILVKMFVPAHI